MIKSAKKAILPVCIAIGAVATAYVSMPIAQQATGEDGQPQGVSTPEPAPNPVKDAVSPKEKENSGGIDPELLQVDEPDNVDLDPSLKVDLSNDDDVKSQTKSRAKVDDKSVKALKDAVNSNSLGKENKKSLGENSNGLIMPRLIGANIPTIPINLLFPQAGGAVAVSERLNELPGTSATFLVIYRLNGTSLKFRVTNGQVVQYENVTVNMLACYKSRPDETNESWAYVDIIDKGEPEKQQLAVLAQRNRAKLREAQGPKRLRKGWMIASSPNVTPVDHPIYDIKLLSCEGGAANSKSVETILEETQAPKAKKKT